MSGLLLSAAKREYLGEGEEVRFAMDSPVEQAGFEPSVPRDTTNFQEAAVCHLLARYSPKACLVPGAQGSRG
jgi:hypothetical protein